MTALALGRVRWDDAIAALRARAHDPRGSHRLAEALSLSALHCRDFPSAQERLREAQRRDPMNPKHALRAALVLLQFGACKEALAAVDDLGELRDLPVPAYVRCLALLRQGELKRASVVGNELLERAPGFRPAQFLIAEGAIRARAKNIEKHLLRLPRDPAAAPMWLDLLIKALLLNPTAGVALAIRFVFDATDAKHRPVLPAGSRERALLERVLRFAQADVADVAELLRGAPEDSRLEQLGLLLLRERLRGPEANARVVALRELHRRLPDRKSVKRLYTSALTDLAVETAGKERYSDALRLIEASMRLAPHASVHFRNRAVIHTLMRDLDGYHDAWLAVDRHNYRLALLGCLGPDSALEVAKIHRMFAQQARLSVGATPGIFRREDDGWTVHQTAIDADPELLRQWIYHRRAELVFYHVALGRDPDHHLLAPRDRRTAAARAAGLGALAGALGVLVPGEGERLAESLTATWARCAAEACQRYGATRARDERVTAVAVAHLEACADLALLCSEWEPSDDELAAEVLEFFEAEAPFLDGELLLATQADREADPSPSLQHLLAVAVGELKLGRRPERLTDEQTATVAASLRAKLLIRLAIRGYNDWKGDPKEGSGRAVAILDRARRLNPADPLIEYFAASFLFLGEYYTEARQALERYYRLADRAHPSRAKADDLLKKLQELRAKKVSGQTRLDGATSEAGAGSPRDRVDELLQELERFPAAIQAYQDLAHLHARARRFDVARGWTEQAIAHCLGRDVQLQARALDLEIVALERLAETFPKEVQLYLAGSRGQALDALESLPAEVLGQYPLAYLRGRCLLAQLRAAEAQRAFQDALAACPRQLHRAVLRPLAQDVERPILDEARQSCERLLADRRFEAALAEAGVLLSRLARPESGLLLLAQVQLAVAVEHLGANVQPPAPTVEVDAPWRDELRDTLSRADPLERAQGLAELARARGGGSQSELEALLLKCQTARHRTRLAGALGESGRRAGAGDWAGALALLDALPEDTAAEPRVMRQRAVLLLRCERFAEADRLATLASDSPEAAEFAALYADLRHQQGTRVIQRHLRAGDDASAEALARELRPRTAVQAMEVAYHLACCAGLRGYRRRAEGDLPAARSALSGAVAQIEGHLHAARAAQFKPLLELLERFEADIAAVEETDA